MAGLPGPGDRIEARCTRCNDITGHVIVALVGGEIVKVECRACVVAAQTLVSEKYAADTLSAWYGGTDLTSGGAAACRQDIFDLAGVSGKSIESVQYDSAAYSVTYLKYWYNAGEYVIYENGSFVFGEGSGGAATPTPNSRPISVGKPQTFIAWPAAYAALPRKAACPKDSSPVKPSSRLNAQAKSA